MAVRMTVPTALTGTVPTALTGTVPTAFTGTVPTGRTGTVPAVPARSVVVPGTVVVAMGRPSRRVRGLLCRGHRPIIARTPEAHCSPRHLWR
jgi:hypothetical protein